MIKKEHVCDACRNKTPSAMPVGCYQKILDKSRGTKKKEEPEENIYSQWDKAIKSIRWKKKVYVLVGYVEKFREDAPVPYHVGLKNLEAMQKKKPGWYWRLEEV